jgi:uncharacterized protein YcnI
MRRNLLRGLAVVGVAAAAVFTLAGPAAAHVTVNPSDATQGGYTTVAFRVPNEKATAQTVTVEINLPTDTPIASVSIKPVPGWTSVTEKSKLATPVKTDDGDTITEAVSKITFTAAAGGAIQADQFQEFEVSMGPLPKADQVVFKVLQTYSDGDVVRWIEESKAGAPEPAHPAPVLKLANSTSAGAVPPAAAVSSTDTSGNGVGTGLGIAGIVLGLAGLVAGLLAYRKAVARA